MGPEALLRQKVKQKRHREGYEDGLAVVHKACGAAYFILSDRPVELLGQFTQLLLEGPDSETAPAKGGASGGGEEEDEEGEGRDPAELKAVAERARRHASTNAEVKELCADLQVLGRREFKQLLKWRMGIRKELERERKEAGKRAAEGKGKGAAVEQEEEEDKEDKLLAEMKAIQDRLDQKGKSERKASHRLTLIAGSYG